MPQIDIQIASASANLPNDEEVERWVSAALPDKHQDSEISIRIVDKDESQALNHQYRAKDKPTNVLSFPADLPDGVDLPLLGDLVICAPVVDEEAKDQEKTLESHWAHMIIHGTLHLLGYDHINDSDAEVMENLEIQILNTLGFANPY